MRGFSTADLKGVSMSTTKNIVIYKDGSWLTCDEAWEYEQDPDWLTTIKLPELLADLELSERLRRQPIPATRTKKGA